MGAVSNTMTLYCIDLTCLCITISVSPAVSLYPRKADPHFIISAKPIASSTPGIANARSCTIDPIAPCSSASGTQASSGANVQYRRCSELTRRAKTAGAEEKELKIRTRLNHLLDRPARIDLHRIQVIEPIHFRSFLVEFLTECIGKVVCRIR